MTKQARQKQRMHRKIALLVSLALILVVAAGSTVAWLADKTDPVENTFTPAQVQCVVEETVENNAKTSITVKVPQDAKNVDAYIRVALIVNWLDENNNVIASDSPAVPLNAAWTANGGYYYYNAVVPVGQSTQNLLSAGQSLGVPENVPAGAASYEIIVSAQAIQAYPADVVFTVWDYEPDGN